MTTHAKQKSDPDQFVYQTLSFLRNITNASIANFFWIDESQFGFTDYMSLGLPEQLMLDYRAGIGAYDPLSVRRAVAHKEPVITLNSEDTRLGSPFYDDYKIFLRKYGVVDEVDMVFSACERPIALISLMRKDGDGAAPAFADYWQNIQAYLQQNLRLDQRFQSFVLDYRLQSRHGLSERERAVVGLILSGAANSEIAELLGIKLSTVKSHVINILDKLGVGSRLGIVSFCQRVVSHDA